VSHSADDQHDGLANELESSGFGPAVLASLGSVALALYYYYVKGDEQRGQFVGLWPATILGIATYLKLAQKESTATDPDAETE
jgi:hypothetical protein